MLDEERALYSMKREKIKSQLRTGTATKCDLECACRILSSLDTIIHIYFQLRWRRRRMTSTGQPHKLIGI